MAKDQGNHNWERFGPNFFIDVGNPECDDYGGQAVGIKATNDEGVNFIISHHENGTSRIESEGELTIQSGSKKEAKHDGPLNVISWGGDCGITAPQDDIRITAAGTITLEANHIVLKGTESIKIGDDSTRDLRLNGTCIEVDGKMGNLPFALGIGWGAAIAFGPGAFVGKAIAKKVFGRCL